MLQPLGFLHHLGALPPLYRQCDESLPTRNLLIREILLCRTRKQELPQES